MILFYVCIGIISLLLVTGIRSGSVDQAVFSGLLSSAVLLVGLTSMIGSKLHDSAQTELQTPAAFCTARQCEPAKPSDTLGFKPTF